MKKIIIFLLLIIVSIYGFRTYSNYQRFQLKNYGYVTKTIPKGSDEMVVQQYYRAVERLNGFVISQWSLNRIDVRNPLKANEATKAAVNEYHKKLADVTILEQRLVEEQQSRIQAEKLVEKEHYVSLIEDVFRNQGKKQLNIGDKGVLVFEIQRALNKKGANIKHDGIFKEETFTALKNFESSKGLYADGKLDLLTLDHLLK